jgi:hypothetical protein
VKKLAIVCGSPSSEMSAPFADEAYEVWVLGNRSNRYPRFDVVFEIHDDLSEHGDVGRYVQHLLGTGKPLVVGEKFPATGDQIERFPFDAARDLFGSTYLTSSSAYMLALALLRGFEHIEIYGVDMAVDDHEYFRQRPCMEAWIGFAKGRGVNVILPARSPVLKSDFVEGRGCGGKPDLALKPFTQEGFLSLAGKHEEKVRQARAQIAALEQQALAHDTAREVYARLAKVARAVESGQTIDNLNDTVVMR